MQRKIVMGGVALLAATLALFWISLTMIGHMMEPSGGGIGGALKAGAIAVVLIAIAVLALICAGRMNVLGLAAAVALMGVASFIPQAIYSARRVADAVEERAEKRALEAKVVAGPYTPEEALDFLSVVTGSDLSNRLLRDHSDVAFALLRRALQEKVIDPNGWIQRPHWDFI